MSVQCLYVDVSLDNLYHSSEIFILVFVDLPQLDFAGYHKTQMQFDFASAEYKYSTEFIVIENKISGTTV